MNELFVSYNFFLVIDFHERVCFDNVVANSLIRCVSSLLKQIKLFYLTDYFYGTLLFI